MQFNSCGADLINAKVLIVPISDLWHEFFGWDWKDILCSRFDCRVLDAAEMLLKAVALEPGFEL